MPDPGDDEQDLRRRALDALHADTLPRALPERTWGGSGSGKRCPVCGRSIEPTEMELELEFLALEVGNDTREFHMHLPCFTAWQSARKSGADE